jgi:hypothetical protein
VAPDASTIQPGENVPVASEIKEAFQALLAKHRVARERIGVSPRTFVRRGQLDTQRALHYVEARLFALSYPEAAERLALEVSSSSTSGRDDLILVTRILASLAKQGRKASENGLLKIASSDDPVAVADALELLADIDSAGIQDTIYAAQCQRPLLEAFFAGPYTASIQVKQTLRDIVAAQEGKSVSVTLISAEAREALTRLEILEEEKGRSKIEQILKNTPIPDQIRSIDWTPWALAVSRRRNDTSVLPLLRERLDLGETYAGSSLEIDSAPLKATEHGYAHSTQDDYYDDVLLTYYALGGKLNKLETTRLTNYGYLGDPKTRLAELSAQKN